MSRVRTVKPVEERRQDIITAARKLFLTNGYRNTSVAIIANELGIAQGLIFHYFKSKAQLLYTVFDEIAAEKQANLIEMLRTFEGQSIDCLEMFFQHGTLNEGYEELFTDLVEDPAIHEYLQDKLTSMSVPMITELIVRGNSDGSWQCDYPEQTAVFLISGLSGILRDHSNYEPNALKEALQSIMLRLLGTNKV
ncbi:MAG: TetR/AcrR family transcriptional regulator [Coriobacteriia bacterium]|nr:TetR/AcrR family transcriptional regulator [Coriobacteriia bacterium]